MLPPMAQRHRCQTSSRYTARSSGAEVPSCTALPLIARTVWSSCCTSVPFRQAFAFALRTPAVGKGRLGNLVYDGFSQAVGGNELGPLAVQGRQAGLARGVDEGHSRQVHAEDRFAPTGQGALPAPFQLPQPRPRQPPFELEGEGPRTVVDRDS